MDCTILNIPNIRPTVHPTTGPSKIAPIITGICIIVAFTGGIGIKPKPVKPSTIEIADSIPTMAICLVLNLAVLSPLSILSSVLIPTWI